MRRSDHGWDAGAPGATRVAVDFGTQALEAAAQATESASTAGEEAGTAIPASRHCVGGVANATGFAVRAARGFWDLLNDVAGLSSVSGVVRQRSPDCSASSCWGSSTQRALVRSGTGFLDRTPRWTGVSQDPDVEGSRRRAPRGLAPRRGGWVCDLLDDPAGPRVGYGSSRW